MHYTREQQQPHAWVEEDGDEGGGVRGGSGRERPPQGMLAPSAYS